MQWVTRQPQSIFRPTNHKRVTAANWRPCLFPHRQSWCHLDCFPACMLPSSDYTCIVDQTGVQCYIATRLGLCSSLEKKSDCTCASGDSCRPLAVLLTDNRVRAGDGVAGIARILHDGSVREIVTVSSAIFRSVWFAACNTWKKIIYLKDI